ncbi:MAG: 3-keto-5-aminohexanoate cleavage protein [Natronomonas sp.]|uniref:3-keto-5-aminohexanoate cleavage protein n=1 Tax=Natronomonas sp. TaxID=2184060 RepID=UPI002870AE1B|nr:3-keto-5-aminohexanoate cleavage protein [Natronomonas sp.]MDR9380577.1 3-keto-5-aminohexanoate cleavage protein [Natronomonas sp.]MDR9430654.1 3-keto-5-aminohexanoate cleavage protein [Natronomonas sp.]
MRKLDKTIISCAVTGAIHTPTMSPHLPITAEEIAGEAIAAAEAGASIVHIHVRDEETGEPVTDLDLFQQVAETIQAECDAIIQPTTGGGPGMPVEERISVVPELEPEMASCNMGSINFGLYQLLPRFDEFEYEWERGHLASSRDYVFRNTFEDLEHILPTFDAHGTLPELEVYDVGHLYNAKHMNDRGLLPTPLHIQFVMGIHGGIGATSKNLNHLIDVAEELFGDDFSFSVIGAGRHEFPLGTQAVSMGGNVRVGLEDNLFIERGQLAESNAELVEKMVRLTHEVAGREVATPAETREFLGVKGEAETNI